MPDRLTLSPIKAIRAKCLECQARSRKAVRNCASDSCPLWHYRMGVHPARAGAGRQISSGRDEKGRYLKKHPSQDGTFADKANGAGEDTPNPPKSKYGPIKREIAISEMHPKKRRKIIRAAEAFRKSMEEP